MRHILAHGAVLAVGLIGGGTRRAAAQGDPLRGIFLQRGCSQCHGIWALGIKSRSDVAPDLTFAYVDVRSRYGMSLETFLNDPSGVMRMMVASHLHLTVADRDSIARVLKGLYERHHNDIKNEVPPIDTAVPAHHGSPQ